MGRFVIAAFKPKPGMQDQLLAVRAKQWRWNRAGVLSGCVPWQISTTGSRRSIT